MVRSKRTDMICAVVLVLTLALTVVFMAGESLGIEASATTMAYESALFDNTRVHTIDIVVDETQWQSLLDNASAKEYIPASIVIDGESVKNIGIRAKGNSSLSQMAMSDSDRYSFKVEFDHYQKGQSYLGLDKLALNNIIQDDTYLKDYLSYQMMVAFDADAPLSSFASVTVNGEAWGLYLAVEGIEESFAQRNYGSNYGQIYKPDSMDMTGGMGNGGGNGRNEMPQMPDFSAMTENGEMPDFAAMMENGEMPDFESLFAGSEGDPPAGDENTENTGRRAMGGGGGGFGGMFNTSDVALVYTDDDTESYANIFDNAVFTPSQSDKERLVASIKQLNEGENLEEVVNIEEVLRYFVVHNYLLNFDSYTGSMLHNYYLYEKDGQMSMIAWDYNLSFGAMEMGGGFGTSSSSSTDRGTTLANYPIDTPISGGDLEDRPMLGQLLADETYMARYHELFAEFIQVFFEDGLAIQLIDDAIALISPYVEEDPSAFCTYEEFVTASSTLREFCILRAESIKGQLDGTIPATTEGQAADSSTLIDASAIDIDSMGSNGFGGGGNRGGMNFQQNAGTEDAAQAQTETAEISEDVPQGMGGDRAVPEGMTMPEGMAVPEGMTLPEGMAMPEGMTVPEGMAMPEGMTLPEGMAAPPDQQAQDDASPTDAPVESEKTEEETTTTDRFSRMGMGAFGGETTTQDDTQTRYILLGASGVILLAGLLFAFFYKRR